MTTIAPALGIPIFCRDSSAPGPGGQGGGWGATGMGAGEKETVGAGYPMI